MINCNLFYYKMNIVYPPFKNGFYLEEYFLNKIMNNNRRLKC